MRFSIVASSLALAVCAAAAPATHVLHERRDQLHSSWTKTIRAPKSVGIPVRIGLTQRNLDLGHDLLMEVSAHDSPKYGQHYTEDEVHNLFAPSSESVNAIRAWLEASGIAKDRIGQSHNKQWLQFDSTIHELESLVKAEYHIFEDQYGQEHVACDEYHVPSHIQHHIDYITPGVMLMAMRGRSALDKRALEKRVHPYPLFPKKLPLAMDKVKEKAKNGDLSICTSVITPECIKAMYNITKGTSSDGYVLGLFEELQYSQVDLQYFFQNVYPEIPQGVEPKYDAIDGAPGPNNVLIGIPEANLDMQISYPIIYPSNLVVYQTDDPYYEYEALYGSNFTYTGFLNNFFYAIDGSYCSDGKLSPLDPPYPDPHKGGYKGHLQCGKFKPTDVISISYGETEATLPPSYMRRQCHEIMKLGMRGITVVAATGDSGVAPPGGAACLSGDGTNNIFTPNFPVNCPYVLAVGATTLPPGAKAGKDQEIATTYFSSGGGFSNVYTRPSYQKTAVETYLNTYPPTYISYQTKNAKNIGANGGQFNSIGRAYPDVSAIGWDVLIYWGGQPDLVGGTSASAPAFASVLARINVERKAANKTTIGFVHPALYANPQVFHDITVGNNFGCGTSGFFAEPGWDPVTGLGTPDYPKMLDLFMGLP